MKPSDLLENTFRLTPVQKTALKKIGLVTIEDMLRYAPTRYGDAHKATFIKNLEPNLDAAVFGRVKSIKTGKSFKGKMPMAKAVIEDDTGNVGAIWFRQPYIAKMIAIGALVKIEGKVTEKNEVLSFVNPHIEEIGALPQISGNSLFDGTAPELRLYPVYPETRHITSRFIHNEIQKAIKAGVLEQLEDPIPEEILKKFSLPTLGTAIIWMHSPRQENDAIAARKRFSFEEIFLIQLKKLFDRKNIGEHESYKLTEAKKLSKEFLSLLPFTPTKAQIKAVEAIAGDISRGHPMSRLVEGDVGSGKTAVAAAAMYAVVHHRPEGKDYGNYQSALMAPTEILATQHFESLMGIFRDTPMQVALVTGSGCKKFPSKVNKNLATDISRAQLLKWVKNGEIPVVVGTQALIQKTFSFKNLALVVIDEQHRFGTNQRMALARKDGAVPHLLSMTATPIPRTLALTLYGDLDISLLDEMPAGRKKPLTTVVLPNKREEVYEMMRKEIKAGRQAYVICPRINEPDESKEKALIAKSVKLEAEYLKEKIFSEFEIGILHSKMTPKEKDAAMKRFAAGETHILVSTSVVEVGVNVPNATMMIIEGAERFGLSQLHQLRGRVIRGTHQPYCFVFTESQTESTLGRLKHFTEAANGFELAEIDLKLRGVGELGGGKQWGVSDIAMEALQNLKLVEAARSEAQKIVDENNINDLPQNLQNIIKTEKQIHFE